VLTLRYVCRQPREGESSDGPVMQADEIVRDAARKVLEVQGAVRVYDGEEFLGVVDDEDILRVVVAEEHPS
jgi:glycine betaine/proline transport system ATP-binding protein